MSTGFTRLVIVGMPRSGTTLVATFLSAQKHCTFITDYVPVFHAVAEKLEVSLTSPLDLTERRVALAMVRDQFLRLRHPVLLGVEDFSTLDALHRAVLGEMAAPDDVVVGHKLVLSADEIRALLRTTDWTPILMIRDPRDAALSFFHRTGGGVEEYVEHWKRVMALLDEPAAAGLWPIRFEELVTDPLKALGPLAKHVGLGLDPTIAELHFKSTVRKDGATFTDNSAFGDVVGAFDKGPIARWRSRRDSTVVRYVGWACREQIRHFGYPDADRYSFQERARFAARSGVVRGMSRLKKAVERLGRVVDRVAPPIRHRGGDSGG